MATNQKVLFTRSNESIPKKRKQSFKAFCSSVWVLSETNLHYRDFCELHGEALKAIYKPVKVDINKKVYDSEFLEIVGLSDASPAELETVFDDSDFPF